MKERQLQICWNTSDASSLDCSCDLNQRVKPPQYNQHLHFPGGAVLNKLQIGEDTLDLQLQQLLFIHDQCPLTLP